MINLLPSDLKQEYLYGRRNSSLRRWATAMLLGLVGACLVTFSGLFYMQRSIDTYANQVAAAEESLKEKKLSETKKEADEITKNLKLAIDVLSKEILFSELLKQIGTVTPANTTLTDLSISEVSGAIELTASAVDYTSATQLQVNLEDPANRIFSKADIQGITCTANVTTGVSSDYPCTMRIRALFASDNPFLFINQKAARP